MAEFLDRSGFAGAQVRALAADASFRRYWRLHGGPRPAVVMDAPPEREQTAPFAGIARHLRGLGFSAPEILAEDPAHGFLLLEDLGDDTFTRMLGQGADETALYAQAVDVLVALHGLGAKAVPPGLAAYGTGKLLEEAMLFVECYLPAVTGRGLEPPAKARYAAAWRRAFDTVPGAPRTLVLRDFHVDNLMAVAGRQGPAACGLLDFQDAVAGHPAYDLMSLLEDARRDIAPHLAAAMRARYAAARGPIDDAATAILGAGRHAKVIGIFTRLDRRDGKPGYLAHIARVWRLLENALGHPALTEVAGWFAENVPPNLRQPPAPATRAAQ